MAVGGRARDFRRRGASRGVAAPVRRVPSRPAGRPAGPSDWARARSGPDARRIKNRRCGAPRAVPAVPPRPSRGLERPRGNAGCGVGLALAVRSVDRRPRASKSRVGPRGASPRGPVAVALSREAMGRRVLVDTQDRCAVHDDAGGLLRRRHEGDGGGAEKSEGELHFCRYAVMRYAIWSSSVTATSVQSNAHVLAGLVPPRLVKSGWTD